MVDAQVVAEGGHTAVLGLVHGDDGRLKGIFVLRSKKNIWDREAEIEREIVPQWSKYGSSFTKIPPQRQINICVSYSI